MLSNYVIRIDDDEIAKQMNGILDTIFKREMEKRYSGTGDVISCAVKELVYSRKDEIIDKVVERATKEIVRKGLPKLLMKGGE